MKSWPALDIERPDDSDLVLAALDEFEPTAVEDRGESVRIFFSQPAQRDAAHRAIGTTFPTAVVDVPDEGWAERSQADLTAITVGRITVAPPWQVAPAGHIARSPIDSEAARVAPPAVLIVIQPSMGFGTGHHATTRLCLAALQDVDLRGRSFLDVGTGSGVLAIAAAKLGAVTVSGVDRDADALRSAEENLVLNGTLRVRLRRADVTTIAERADVVTANLTGALLSRSAAHLAALVNPGGTLIVSGLQVHERDQVRAAFGALQPVWEREEDGWVGLGFNVPGPITV
jgi:ribosomal protein L11 methyltransferase